MEGVGGWSYPGCSHEDVLLSVQVGGSMCVYRPAIAAISIKHRVTMPQSPLYLDIYVSTRSSSRQASDKERCGQASQLPSGQCPYHNANYSTAHHHHCRHHHFDPAQVSIYLTHIVDTSDHVTALSHISTYLPSPHIRMHAPSPVSWLKLEF